MSLPCCAFPGAAEGEETRTEPGDGREGAEGLGDQASERAGQSRGAWRTQNLPAQERPRVRERKLPEGRGRCPPTLPSGASARPRRQHQGPWARTEHTRRPASPGMVRPDLSVPWGPDKLLPGSGHGACQPVQQSS